MLFDEYRYITVLQLNRQNVDLNRLTPEQTGKTLNGGLQLSASVNKLELAVYR